ncbi:MULTISPECIES: DUF2971 domain-containing protein [unclassified Undibacterium]|uniref:DUF2971 domain-containing protein n=1 Tax=unclassified Undibacterium TaxID=2630295 RepID=UPI00164AD5F0|nr:DUF2971 domain-containing protein [Undibacterium sp. FT79W]MBC3927483.1 DUF2971 domain-containing protein [Undibacterium sp. CY21W]
MEKNDVAFDLLMGSTKSLGFPNNGLSSSKDVSNDNVLYKFRSFNSIGLRILIDREIYFAAPASLNDPLDCRLTIGKQLQFAIDSEKPGFAKDLMLNFRGRRVCSISENLDEDMHESIEKIVQTTGVFSLSENVKDPLMWSHYGNAHLGFCIGFHRNYFNKMLTNHKKYGLLGGSNVEYCATPPFIDLFKQESKKLADLLSEPNLTVEKAQRLITDHHHFYTNRIIAASLSSKSNSWAYEKEYRLVRTAPGVVEFSEEAIAEIVFGCNASTHDIATVKRILGGAEWKHVEFKRVQFAPLSFELELVPA